MKISTKISYYISYFKTKKWAKRYLTDDFSSEELVTYKTHIWTKKLDKTGIKIYFNDINKEASKKRKKYWDNYLERTLPEKQENIKLEISKTPALTAIIVEARKHPHFKIIVENIISNLQHLKVGLIVYHGKKNEIYVKNCLKKIENIMYINLEVDNLDIEAYNKIMLSKKFHETIKTDKFLVFQTDTISFTPLDKKFLNYDYIGAPWKKELHKEYKAEVGNGGLSLRSKSAMLNIISQNIPREKNLPEDLYLAQILKKQNFKVASYQIALEFATEDVFNNNAFGCHKSWELIKFAELKQLLRL